MIRLFDGALAPTESVSKYFYEYTPVEKEKRLLRVFKVHPRPHLGQPREAPPWPTSLGRRQRNACRPVPRERYNSHWFSRISAGPGRRGYGAPSGGHRRRMQRGPRGRGADARGDGARFRRFLVEAGRDAGPRRTARHPRSPAHLLNVPAGAMAADPTIPATSSGGSGCVTPRRTRALSCPAPRTAAPWTPSLGAAVALAPPGPASSTSRIGLSPSRRRAHGGGVVPSREVPRRTRTASCSPLGNAAPSALADHAPGGADPEPFRARSLGAGALDLPKGDRPVLSWAPA